MESVTDFLWMFRCMSGGHIWINIRSMQSDAHDGRPIVDANLKFVYCTNELLITVRLVVFFLAIFRPSSCWGQRCMRMPFLFHAHRHFWSIVNSVCDCVLLRYFVVLATFIASLYLLIQFFFKLQIQTRYRSSRYRFRDRSNFVDFDRRQNTSWIDFHWIPCLRIGTVTVDMHVCGPPVR